VGVPLGVLSAVKRGSILDYLARGFALFGSALPVFWVAIVFILIFSVELGWLPTSQRAIGGSLWTQTQHFIMPTITLAWLPASTYLRLTRSAVLETLDTEYIKLARAKGLTHNKVIWKHAFRNALIQPLTVSALLLAGFITGAVLIESVFAWPGLGRLAVQAIFDNEFPILMGVVLIFAVAYVTMNFLADLAYAWIDPRIRY
jgi:ABC-type dipeptide/oligopeptide/nickel transport system permease component